MLLFKVKKNLFKAIAWIFFFILLVRLLSYCEEEKSQSRSYPRVKTYAVTNITDKGATFNGEIYSPGTEPIINHGFVWSEGDNPTLLNNKILLGADASSGGYSAEIFSSLTKDVEYTVKAVVQTAEHVIYGTPVTFKSLGSGAPVITGFEPDSAAWLDTVIIRGKNFSWVRRENIVRLNQLECETVSSSDTTLSVVINKNISELSTTFSVELAGKSTVYAGKLFILKPPLLKDYYPKHGMWGDSIFLIGRNLKVLTSNSSNYAKLGNVSCQFLGTRNDSTIMIEVPPGLTDLTSGLSLLINGFNMQKSDLFQLDCPYIFNISPKESTWGQILTLTGRFNRLLSNSSVEIGGYPANIQTISRDQITVRIPNYINGLKEEVKYTATPFSVTTTDSLVFLPPIIESFTPIYGSSGTIITINGENFGNWWANNVTVWFGTIQANLLQDSNAKTIRAIVPEGGSGPVKISVKVNSQKDTSIEDFTFN